MDEYFTTFIKDWCKKYCIIQKCKKNFWKCFESYKAEHPKEFSEHFRNENRKCVTLNLDKICLCLNYEGDYGRPTIQVDFRIMLKDNEVGWYREIYFSNGDFVDEYFVLE